MPHTIRVGIIGGGWPGEAHAGGYIAAGGFALTAVADLIPQRRAKLAEQFSIARQYAQAKELLADARIEAVSICLPNFLHAPVAIEALRSGKHVLCEKPPALSVREARQIARAAHKSKRVLMYSFQRRFGAAEQAAKQAITKGYAGEAYHARASWMRTRGVPVGTGWFTDKSKSGGGALIDIGVHMLDLAWHLLGQPRPLAVYGLTHRRFGDLLPQSLVYDVEDSAFALVRFEGNKSLELSASWAINQPPAQNGTVCRVYGQKAAIEVYTPEGATLYRNFDSKGGAQAVPLKGPKLAGHAALARNFREAIAGRSQPQMGPQEAVQVMRMVEAIYRSDKSGRSVTLKHKTS